MNHISTYSYRRGGRPIYIERPNKIAVKNAMTNPQIQNPMIPGPGTVCISFMKTNCLPLSKVVELQKQLSDAPVTFKKHIDRISIAEIIATNFPNHRQIIAPAVQRVCDRDRVGTRPGRGRDM